MILKNCGQAKPPNVFYKKDTLKRFAKFSEKHLCWSLFFNELAVPSLSLFLIKFQALRHFQAPASVWCHYY